MRRGVVSVVVKEETKGVDDKNEAGGLPSLVVKGRRGREWSCGEVGAERLEAARSGAYSLEKLTIVGRPRSGKTVSVWVPGRRRIRGAEETTGGTAASVWDVLISSWEMEKCRGLECRVFHQE